MKAIIDTVKNNILPLLEKDSSFDSGSLNISFWELFTIELLDFKENANLVYLKVFKLELEPQITEKIISILPKIYSHLIMELAEKHVLNNTSELTNSLISSKNKSFANEVSFLKNLEYAIMKNERAALKQKMKEWDKEI